MIPSAHPLRDAVGPQTQPAGAWIWLDSRLNALCSNPAALALLAANPTLLRVRRHHLHALQAPALLKSSLQEAAQGQPAALVLRSVVMVASRPGVPSGPPSRPTPRPTSPPTRGGWSK